MGEISLPSKMINGAVAGMTGVTCIFPIDLVKTRLQNQQIINGKPMYKNIADCFIKTARSEGFFGLYKGYAVNLTLITPEKALKLAGNDVFRYLLQKDGTLPLHRQALAGAGAGLCQVVATTPMELLKIQLQDAGRKVHKEAHLTTGSGLTTTDTTRAVATTPVKAVDIARDLIRKRGLLGLYRGLGATMFRDIPWSAMYFPLFAHLNDMGSSSRSGKASFQHTFTAGCAAASICTVAVTPMDVVKTRIQTLQKAPGEQSYTGIVDCFVKICREEGPSALFKGATARVLTLAPLFGIAQGVYFIGVGEFVIDRSRRLLH